MQVGLHSDHGPPWRPELQQPPLQELLVSLGQELATIPIPPLQELLVCGRQVLLVMHPLQQFQQHPLQQHLLRDLLVMQQLQQILPQLPENLGEVRGNRGIDS